MTYDAHPTRHIVHVNNIHKIDGVYLEDIPEIAPGYAPGYVIIYREWPSDIFLMKKREGLSSDEIYRMVDILLQEKNIKPHPLD